MHFMRDIFKHACFLWILFSGSWQLSAAQEKCREGPLDIFFIVETSRDTGRKSFENVRSFIVNVARQIDVGPESNRFSITVFNKEVQDVMMLNETTGVPALRKLLAGTKFWGGGNRATNVGKAMEYVADKFSNEPGGRRPELDAVCVIIIEGVSSDLSAEPAAELRKHCRIIVFGIDRPNYFELSKIASEPTQGHVRVLQTFVDLVRFEEWTAETICKPPISQMLLERGRITDRSIQVVWTMQPFASQYFIQIRLSGGKEAFQSKTAASNQTSVTFRDLEQGTRYSLDAWAIDGDGKRGPQAVSFLSTGIEVPKMVLDPLSVTKTTFTVSWASSDLRGVFYYITVKRLDTNEVVISTSVSGNSYQAVELSPGRSYVLELAVLHRGERSESDDRLVVHTIPDAPQISLGYVTDRSAKLEWESVKGAATYSVRTYDIETSTGVDLLVRVDEVNGTSFIVEPLLSGKLYRFDASSKTIAGTESEERSSVTARIAPTNPSRLELVSRTTRSINVTWDARVGVESYLVQFKAINSPDWLKRTVSATFFSAQALGVGTVYIFNVYSLGQNSEYDTENPATLKVQTVPQKIGGLRVQSITQNSVTLQWNRVRGAKLYLLRFRDANTEELLKTERVSQQVAEIDGLETGITYLITVAAVGEDGVQSRESDPQMVITLPDVPGRPRLADKTNSTLTFEWDSVQGAIQYMLELQADGESGPKQLRTSDTAYKFEDLKPGVWHTFRIRSVGSGGRINMELSDPARGLTVPRIPEKPQIVKVSASSVTVTWKKVTGAVGYILNVRIKGDDGLIESRNTTNMRYTINNLNGGESYFATLIAFSYDLAESAESEPTLIETMPDSPGKPRVVGVTSTTVTLEWDPIKGASSYVVSISDLRRLTEVQTQDSKLTIEKLRPSTHYSFGLYSVAIEGSRNQRESERTATITAPSPPPELFLADVGTTYVEISWIHVRGAISYIIRYRSIKEDAGLVEGEVTASIPTNKIISNLTAGLLYEFSIFSVGQSGSKSDPGVLIDGTLPATPKAPLVLLVGSTNVTLSWSLAKGALSYIAVARSTDFEKQVPSNGTRVEIDGLDAGTRYEFTVMSVGVNGRVNFYESRKTREQTLTSPPNRIWKEGVTTDQITVAWEKMKGALYYSVELEYVDDTKAKPRKFMSFRTSYKVNRLDAGSRHRIRVASVGSNFIESRFSEPIVVATVPETPGAPRLVSVTTSSIQLSWRPVQGSVFYSVVMKEDGKEESVVKNSTQTEVTFSDLAPGRWFELYLLSVGVEDQINKEKSEIIRIQTVPAAPKNFRSLDETISSVSLTWDAVTGASSYRVTVGHESSTSDVKMFNGTDVTISSLKPGTVYSFTVAAVTPDRTSENAPAVVKSTKTEVPSQPVVSEVTNSTVIIAWEKVAGAVKYAVYYGGLEEETVTKQETPEEKMSIRELSSGTWFQFWVASIGAGGLESAKSKSRKEQTVPMTPANFRVKNVGMDFISVIWDTTPGAASYRASYEERKVSGSKKVIESDETEIIFSKLSPGTDYIITVQSVGASGRRSAVSLPLAENTIPATPKSLVIDDVETSLFKVSWNEVEGASSYVVEITPEIGRPAFYETQRPEWVTRNAEPGKWYRVNVQSKDRKNRGNGITSDIIRVQTICQRPSNVKISEIGTDFVKMSWKEMNGADFYVVTMRWNVGSEILNPFGGRARGKDVKVEWERESDNKKDGLQYSKLEEFSIDRSEVVVKGEEASYQFQTKSREIQLLGLVAATRYHFELETVNQQGRVSTRKSFLNETTLPVRIEAVQLLMVTESTATLAWPPVRGAFRYIVNVTRQSNGVVTSFTTPEASISLERLSSGSWHDVVVFVVGRNQKINFNGSSELNFQTTPARPEGVRVWNVTTTTIGLDWEDNEGAAFYKIQIKLTEPFDTLLRTDESRSSRHVVEKLSTGTKYMISVVSVASGGRESLPSRFIVESTIPDKPRNLRLNGITKSTADLQWDAATGAVAYVLAVRDEDGKDQDMRTAGTVMRIEDLSAGVWYEFRVRSVGSKGRINFDESNVVRQQTVPASPGSLEVEEVTTSTISLRWGKVHGVKHYRLFVENDDDTQVVHNVTRNFFTLSRLGAGQTFTIRVLAVATNGLQSQKSAAATVATVPESAMELEIVEISTTNVKLKWQPVIGAVTYLLIVRDPITGTIVTSMETFLPEHIVTGLEPGRTYSFSVVGRGKDGTQSRESPQKRIQTTPLAPTGVRTAGATTSTIGVRWDPVPGMKSYQVIVQEEGDENRRTEDVQTTEHTVSGLRSGSLYSVFVVSVGGRGRKSEPSEVISEATYPSPPDGVTIADVTSSSIDLKWNSVRGALKYIVDVTGDDKTNKQITVTREGVTIPGLSSGIWYGMRVTAVGPMQRTSRFSESVRDQTEPDAPSDVVVTKTGTTWISIEWGPGQGVKFYEIRVTSQGGNTRQLVSVATDFRIDGLTPGLSHEIDVLGVGTSGRRSSPSETLRHYTVPAATEEVVVEEVSSTSVTLRWSQVTGASTFTIVIRSSSEDDVMRSIVTGDTEYKVEGLLPGGVYAFSVRSKGVGGKPSKESPRIQVQTVPLPPSDITVSSIAMTQIQISWKKSNGAAFYRVHTEDESGKLLRSDDVEATQHSVDRLKAGTTYRLFVSAVGRSGRESGRAGPVIQTTKPQGPSDLSVENIRTNSISLSWLPTEGSTGYKVLVVKSGSEESVVFDSIVPRFMVENLDPGWEYSMSVVSVGSDGQESAPSTSVTSQTLPSVPRYLEAVTVTETAITVTWEPANGAAGYFVTVADLTIDEEAVFETTLNRLTLSELPPGTEFEFKVQSVGQNGKLNPQFSDPLLLQTVSSAVLGLGIISTESQSVTLSWNASAGSVRYSVAVRSNNLLVQTLETSQTQIIVENLTPGKQYSLSVVGIAANGARSEESDPLVATTGIATPQKPEVISVNNSTVTLSWKRVSGAREYVVSVIALDDDINTFRTDEETFVARNLRAGTSYSFRVSAIGTSGDRSDQSEAINVDTVPARPTISGVGDVGPNSMRISWLQVRGAVSYVVTANWTPLGTRTERNVRETTTEPFLVMTLPETGTSYEITVSAEGRSGLGVSSDVVIENTLPASPTAVRERDVTSNSISIFWQPAEGAASYEVLVNGEEGENSQTVTRPTLEIDQLQPGNWYELQIFSIDAKNRKNEQGSQPIRVQTVPNAPRDAEISNMTTQSVTIEWTPVRGAALYVVSVSVEEEGVSSFDEQWTAVRVFDGVVTFDVLSEETSVTIQRLNPGTFFQLEVRSTGDKARSSESVVLSGSTLPGEVADIVVRRISSSSVTLEWSEVGTADSYRVTLEDDVGVVATATVQEPAITFEELPDGTWFRVFVVTFDSQNRSSFVAGPLLDFQSLPRDVTGIRTTSVSTSGLTLVWESVRGASGYEVTILWRSDEVSATHLQREGQLDSRGLARRTFAARLSNLSIAELDPGTTYWFEIVAVSEEGRRGGVGQRQSETTLPSGISDIDVNSVSESVISISWEEVKGAQSYFVDVSSLGVVISQMEVDRPQIVVGDLEPGTEYVFIVRPVGNKERVELVANRTETVKTRPSSPKEFKVDDFTVDSIFISWNAPKGSVRFVVTVEYVDNNRQTQGFLVNSFEPAVEVGGLDPGVAYRLFVVAYGDEEEESASAKSETIVQRTAVSAPTNLRVEEFGEDFVTVSWDASEGASSYMVYATDQVTGRVIPVEFPDASQARTIVGLDSGILYTLVVRAIAGVDDILSEPSLSVEQRTEPGPPRFVRVSRASARSMVVEWMAVTGADTYTVFVTEIGFPERPIAGQPTNDVTIRELKPGTEYRIQIVAVTVEGLVSRRSAEVTQITAPNAPGDPVVKFFSTNTIEIEWIEMKGATTYVVTVTNEETEEYYEENVGSSLTMEADDLEPGTDYSFTVRGENIEQGLRSEESQKTLQSTSPEAPDVEVVSFNPFSISLSWGGVKGASHYDIYVRFAGNERVIRDIVPTNHTIVNLEAGTEYQMQVVAVSWAGLRSDRSLRVLQTTAPNAPSELEPENVTQSSIAMSWAPAKGATQYRLVLIDVERRTRSVTIVQGSRRHIFSGLLPGTLYSAHAFAITLPDFTRSVRSASVTQRTLPNAPRNLVVYDVQENSVSLEWSRTRGSRTYTIFVSNVDQTTSLERQIKDVRANQITVDRLSPGSTYRFEVAGVTEFGLAGAKSDPVEQQTVPAPPQDVVVSEVAETSLRLNWTRSEGALSYTIRLVDVETDVALERVVGNITTVRLFRLTAGTLYEITMVSRRRRADMTSSSSYPARTRLPPIPPTGLEVYLVTANSVGLQWQHSKGASAYDLLLRPLDESGFPTDQESSVDGIVANEVEVTQLDPGSQYVFEIYALTEDGQISSESASIVQATRYPAPYWPEFDEPFLRLSNASADSMRAEWKEVPNAVSYTIILRSETADDIIISDIEDNSLTLRNLLPDTEYVVTVVAVGRSGDATEESNPATLRTRPGPPPAPSDVVSSFTRDSVSLQWSVSPGAVFYQVESTDLETNETKVAGNIVSPRYDVKGLTPGRMYRFRVIAIGLHFDSTWSGEIVTGARYPSPVMRDESPALMRLLERGWNFITVEFLELPNAVSYALRVRTGGEIVREIGNATNLQQNISGLSEFTDYEISYVGVGEGGDVTKESRPRLSVKTLPHTPEVPTGVAVSDISAETAVLEWGDASRALSYDVIITTEDEEFEKLFRNVKESPYIAVGLTFNTTYFVRIVSNGRFDRSQPSDSVEFETKIPKPGFIRLLLLTKISENEIGLRWSPAAYAVSYVISVFRGSKAVRTLDDIRGNSIIIQNLDPETLYRVEIQAIGISGVRGEAKMKTVRTSPAQDRFEEEPNEFEVREKDPEQSIVEEIIESETAVPTNLKEALRSLVDRMASMPRTEHAGDEFGNVVFKEKSSFQVLLRSSIEAVRSFLLDAGLEDVRIEKSADAHNIERNREAFDEILAISRTLSMSPATFRKSGANKLALEIASLLTTIFVSSPDFDDSESSGLEDFTEAMTPLLEDPLLEVILGEFKVEVSNIYQRMIALTPSGKLPTKTVIFSLRQTSRTEVTDTILIRQNSSSVRFTGLQPGTEYEVTAVSEDETSLYSELITTKSPAAVKPLAPSELKLSFASRTFVSIRWNPVRRGNSVLGYIVRVYKAGAKTAFRRFPVQRTNAKSITRLTPRTSYEITVATYNINEKLQSLETERLLVRTR